MHFETDPIVYATNKKHSKSEQNNRIFDVKRIDCFNLRLLNIIHRKLFININNNRY